MSHPEGRGRYHELRPIKESPNSYDRIEARIKAVFKEMVYMPILRELNEPKSRLSNALTVSLFHAISSGRIKFSHGRFKGHLSASIVKEIKVLGGTWDKTQGAFTITLDKLPAGYRAAIAASESKFQERIAKIDRRLAELLPEEISGMVKVENLFDSTLFKVDSEFLKTIKGISIAPKLTAASRKKIAQEWQQNMELWIRDFAAEEIVKLRKSIRTAAEQGNRYEASIAAIQKSYDVTANKAKFLARQETGLLMAKFKETRYRDAGVNEYKWGCVAGSKLHPVRHSHKILEGKTFRWDDPPVTTAPNQAARRNNPGQDFGCRCFARPLIKFKETQ